MVEKDVEDIVKKWLERQGYTIEAPHTNGYQSLIDIYAWKKGEQTWFIEAKSGEKQIYDAFGQLIAQANRLSKGIKNAIALPSLKIKPYIVGYLEKFADTDPKIWKMLNLHFLLIDKEKVNVIPPEKVEKFLKSCVRSKWKK